MYILQPPADFYSTVVLSLLENFFKSQVKTQFRLHYKIYKIPQKLKVWILFMESKQCVGYNNIAQPVWHI